MAAIVVYDAWLSQQALKAGSVETVTEWDWDAVDALIRDLKP